MTRIWRRRAPGPGTFLTVLALAATPHGARAQDPGPPAGYFSTVAKAWTFSGCGQGTAVARPDRK